MTLLLPALAALAFFVWLGRRSDRGGDWRPAGAVAGWAAFLGAAIAGVRGEWLLCAGLLAAGGALTMSVKRPASRPSVAAARALLGVDEEATPEAVRAAHRRLLWEAHPDRGGDQRRAAALNAARDRLLKG